MTNKQKHTQECNDRNDNHPYPGEADCICNRTQKTRHTPLPWAIERVESGKDLVYYKINGNTKIYKNSIAGTSEANAAFIVTACNSHYELLEACKLTIGYAGAGLLGNEAAKIGKLKQIVSLLNNVVTKAERRG